MFLVPSRLVSVTGGAAVSSFTVLEGVLLRGPVARITTLPAPGGACRRVARAELEVLAPTPSTTTQCMRLISVSPRRGDAVCPVRLGRRDRASP